MATVRRSRSPERNPNRAVRRSRSPRPDTLNDSSLSENDDSHEVHSSLSSSNAGSEEFEDGIGYQADHLRQHLGLPKAPGMPTPELSGPAPLFFVERAPDNRRGGAQCKLSSCFKTIKPESYRIALNPSMDPVAARYGSQNSDFYHIKCFEKIADFSQSDFNKRVLPVTRRWFSMRGLKGNQILDGNYLCGGGAERLILEWKVARGRALDARDGVEDAEDEPMSPKLNNLLRKAGSAGFKGESVEGMTPFEYMLLSTDLAPWESDGPEDEAEWNLFDQYLVTGNTEDRHTLSKTLNKWSHAIYLATSGDAALSDESKRQKEDLGEKGRRAIRRLSAVPMPDLQSAFFGR